MSSDRSASGKAVSFGLWAIVVIIVSSGLTVLVAPADHPSPVGPANSGAAFATTPPLQITSLTVEPTQLTPGSQFSASATVSGGVLPYTYAWSGFPPPCAPGNVSSYQCTVATNDNPGPYTISLQVEDANHTTASGSQGLTVDAALSINGINISPNPVSSGSSFQVSVSVSGGVPPYSYNWAPVPPGCPNQNSSSWSCSESQTGEFPIGLSVRDAQGNSQGISRSINVSGSSNNNGGGNNNNSNHNNNNNGSSNNNNSNGFNLSSFGPYLLYGLIAAVVAFALLVTLTVGVIVIAVTLSRRLPKPVKDGIPCPACHAMAPPGAKFCPSCAAPLAPPK